MDNCLFGTTDIVSWSNLNLVLYAVKQVWLPSCFTHLRELKNPLKQNFAMLSLPLKSIPLHPISKVQSTFKAKLQSKPRNTEYFIHLPPTFYP